MKGLNELRTLQIQITFAFTHSMLIRILHTQFQLRQTELTNIVMFCTVHYCIVNDKFGYKYRKQSADRLHFLPIPRRTLNRTICILHRLQFHFFRFFLFFFVFFFDEQDTFSSFFSSERVATLSPGVTPRPRVF